MEIIATHEQHIRNTEVAIVEWASVDPKSVSKDLSDFRDDVNDPGAPSCDSPACFGGHLPHFPYFHELGVRQSAWDGGPGMLERPGLEPAEIAVELFGDRYLFDPRRPDEVGADHEVVTARLAANLRRLMAR